MLDPRLFLIADTLMAAFLALGFLIAYLADRKLAAFRWWAGFYALLTIPVGTTGLRFDAHSVWLEIGSWGGLFAAAGLAAYGMYRENQSPVRPYNALFVSTAILFVVMLALTITGATPDEWAIWGVTPTILFIFWITLRLMTHKRPHLADLAYGAVIIVAAALIGARSLWFASVYPVVANQLPFPPHADVQILVVFLATILAMVGHAVALTLRITLSVVGRMRETSSRDALSGLFNRGTFDELAVTAGRLAGSTPFSVAVFDIDLFKKVNDTAGHAAGDRVIAALGSILQEACGEQSVPGRVGGEEFAVLLPNTNLGLARLFAEAVRTRFAACDYGDEIPWEVTLSGGIAERRVDEPIAKLMERADQALYAAKNGGRNRIAAAPATLVDEAPSRTA